MIAIQKNHNSMPCNHLILLTRIMQKKISPLLVFISLLILGVEIGERFAYYGILSNLINFLTEHLHQSTASAAVTVNVWVGTLSLLPLFGSFIADSYLGRYRPIIIASLIYLLGLELLTVSAMCPSPTNFKSHSSGMQVILFFTGLYLVAFGQGGHKPCVQAFGADQFDEHHPEEGKARSSFFTWWNCALCASIVVPLSGLAVFLLQP